ncbi:GroES-like protein [Microstroma glucosiphilum]|uniref:GroES-like protein n=1 Tax=Pseudomicrostroma glucosiphilum TaxID=1684307 RepID=A0A316U401_9BASI|nr:GroES-like protein [Pseudomicrostroma glucosiphilum]PWN19103.1 GroES-like protein [Pseudomicrostroma glucosiphilum]
MSTSTESTNIAAVLHGAKDLRIEERQRTAPGPGEVQIRIRATGLCGSDAHYFAHGRNGSFALQAPMALGHESAGEIVAIGSEVPTGSNLTVGARVAVEAGIQCRSCDRCKEGRYNLCSGMRFASSAKTFPHLDGTLQKYLNWPYWAVHLLPSDVSFRSAALVEPLAVVLQGFRRANLKAGESVLITGAGAVGLLACAAAKALGARYVAAVDIDANRLKFAVDNGWADETYLLPRGAPAASGSVETDARLRRMQEDEQTIAAAQATAASLLDAFKIPTAASTGEVNGSAAPPSAGFDAVFECSGVPSCVQAGIFAARAGGRIVLIGMGTPVQTLPIGAAALREVDILGVFRYAGIYTGAIQMLSPGGSLAAGSSKRGSIESVISHTFPLANAVEAFQTFAKGKGEDGRPVVKIFIEDM